MDWLRRAWRETRTIVLTVGLVFLAEAAIAQPFIVPSGSMEPTLRVGDEIAATKFPYGYSRYSAPIGTVPGWNGRLFAEPPARGDVAVFALPRDPSETYVKRVIGLPGDRVQLREGELYINGTLVPRRKVGSFVFDGRRYTRYVETLPGGRAHDILKLDDDGAQNNTPVYTVPSGHYFMMGDNRDDSLDSRWSAAEGGVGFVPAENLVGRADLVLFSIAPFAQWRDVLARPWDLRLSRLFDRVE